MECGTRRGPLPPRIASVVSQILEQGSAAEPPAAEPCAQRPVSRPARRGGWLDIWAPNPIAASLAVMAMLGFGVIVGDIPGAEALFNAAAPTGGRSIVVNLPPGERESAPVNHVGTIITETTPAPAAAVPAPAASTTTTNAPTNTTTGSNTTATPSPRLGLPPVKHVFLIVLSDQGYPETFSVVSKDTYLNKTLPAQGELIQNYYAVAGSSLANEIAMVSGQGPTEDTAANCPRYVPIRRHRIGRHDQVVGNGCIYPPKTHNLASQLTADHATWKAYLEGLDDGPKAQLKNCGQPAIGGSQYGVSTRKDPYLAYRNPFAYFATLRRRSICRTSDVPLPALAEDLKTAKTTPSLSFIVPDACDDGSPHACHHGAPVGLGPANAFLERTLKLIEASPAYKASGLIAITFDHAQQSGRNADQSACCSTPRYPNLATKPAEGAAPTATTPTTTTPATTTPGVTMTPTSTGPYAIAPAPTTTGPYEITPAPTTTTTTPTPTTTGTTTSGTTTTPPPLTGGETTPTGGGGQVGLLLLSKYVMPGSSDQVDYFNHFSLLAALEALFRFHTIADASGDNLPRFTTAIYNSTTN